MGPIMNLISGSHNFCKRREYAFNVLLEYSIITLERTRTRSLQRPLSLTLRERERKFIQHQDPHNLISNGEPRGGQDG